VGVSSAFARSYLRNAWAEAQAAGQTLLAKLNALNATAISNAGSGKTIVSTSGNGRSVSFDANSAGNKPSDIVEMLDRMFRLYDAAVAAGNATDATRYAYMLGGLVAARSVRNDFRLMRSPRPNEESIPLYP